MLSVSGVSYPASFTTQESSMSPGPKGESQRSHFHQASGKPPRSSLPPVYLPPVLGGRSALAGGN